MEVLGEQGGGLRAPCPLSVPCSRRFFHLLFLSCILHNELVIVNTALP